MNASALMGQPEARPQPKHEEVVTMASLQAHMTMRPGARPPLPAPETGSLWGTLGVGVLIGVVAVAVLGLLFAGSVQGGSALYELLNWLGVG